MGRDEGMMEANTEKEGVKTETTEGGLYTKKGKGRNSDRKRSQKQKKVRRREQTLPWQAPVRWFGMNPLLQGLG